MLREWHPQAAATTDASTSEHHPSEESALRAIIRAAHRAGQHVTIAGQHADRRASADPAIQRIALASYNRVLNIDTVAQTITVQAGITLSELNIALAEHRLALPALDTTPERTLSHVLSTGSHGASMIHGSLTQRIIGLTLIDGTGEVRRASRTENPELFAAACVGLGCIGVLSTVTLHAVPAFRLALHSRRLPFSDAVAELPALVRASEYPELVWLPGTPYAILRTLTKTSEPSDPPPSYITGRLAALFRTRACPLTLELASRRPAMRPLTNRVFRYLLFGRGEGRVGPSHLLFNGPISSQMHVIEYAVAIEQAQEALHAAQQMLREQRPQLQTLLDVRFSGADQAWLSPSYGRESCLVSVLIYQPPRRQVQYEASFRQLDKLFQALGGRPHWGAEHRASTDYLARCYPRWADFQQIRSQVDPAGTLLSPYLARRADGKIARYVL